jgi:serine protease inhibitor
MLRPEIFIATKRPNIELFLKIFGCLDFVKSMVSLSSFITDFHTSLWQRHHSSGNYVYSPYSLAIALLSLGSVFSKTDRKSLLKSMSFPVPNIPPTQLHSLIQNFTHSVENIFIDPSPSPTFLSILSKCPTTENQLNDDDKFLLYSSLLDLLRKHAVTFLSDESLFQVFEELITDEPNTPLFTHFCETLVSEVSSYPRVIGGNELIVNNDTLNRDFDVPVTRLKFDKNTVGILNRRIENLTRGLIKHPLSENSISSSAVYVMINTLVFIGKWRNPFKQVHKREFILSDGNKIQTTFLGNYGTFKYHSENGFQYIAIRYQHCPFQFELILPSSVRKFAKLEKVGPELFGEFSRKAVLAKLDLHLPQFEINSPLLDFSAEFTIPESATVSQVGMIAVDQFGTKAAAGTIIIEKEVVEIEKEVIVDRPFIFQIRGKKQGILYAGILMNPQE